MSVQEHINLWEFLDSRSFDSTQNLKELSGVLLTGMSSKMNAYGWEYEEWIDDLSPENDGEDDYYNAVDSEENDFEQELLRL